MKALLQPGDKIAIRSDIKDGQSYKMRLGEESNTYVGYMASPGEVVTIGGYRHNQYYVEEDDFWNYTDEMFDPELISYLYEEYLNNI